MVREKSPISAITGAAALLVGAAPIAAQAQDGATTSVNSDQSGEIIVTARKRNETEIAVPVIMTAIPAEEIKRRAISNFDELGRIVPQLVVSDSGGSVQGGSITIRGIGAGPSNPYADQAVSFNLDGAQVARSSVRRMSEMDIAQIEVLKGPQALFFGKNSPGGVISVRTADPTPNFEAQLTAAFEPIGMEWRGEGYISTPLTDDLGLRVAFFGSKMRGWSKNVAPESSPYADVRRHWPNDEEYAGRLTLKYEPDDRFNARFKFNYGHLEADGTQGTTQYLDCPLGAPQTGDIDECRANDHVTRGNLGTSFNAVDPEVAAAYRDGQPYMKQSQILTSLELNYKLADKITLTSVTSYYHMKFSQLDNYTNTLNPDLFLPSHDPFWIDEFSQELRLSSEFGGPLNFVVGGHYQHSKLKNNAVTLFNANDPTLFLLQTTRQKGEAYSAFGQVLFDIVPTLQLSAGGRYSYETKKFSAQDRTGYTGPPPVDYSLPKDSWNDFSPEISLSWRPNSNATVFVAYKEGFLSGGYNGGELSTSSYDQQSVKGFEGGVKLALLDRTLRANLGLYSYELTGLQVTTVTVTTQEVTNAGKSRIKGIEADFTWDTPLEGLTLRGALAYNHARYNVFNLGCYRGQTLAMGCNLAPDGDGVFTLQNLAGHQIVRAPDWSGNVGASFVTPISDGWEINLSVDGAYTSGFFTNAPENPGSRMPAYWLLDAGVRLVNEPGGWEFGVLGRNLTDKYYYSITSENPFSGGPAGTNGPTYLADTVGAVSRGREILFRASKKF